MEMERRGGNHLRETETSSVCPASGVGMREGGETKATWRCARGGAVTGVRGRRLGSVVCVGRKDR